MLLASDRHLQNDNTNQINIKAPLKAFNYLLSHAERKVSIARSGRFNFESRSYLRPFQQNLHIFILAIQKNMLCYQLKKNSEKINFILIITVERLLKRGIPHYYSICLLLVYEFCSRNELSWIENSLKNLFTLRQTYFILSSLMFLHSKFDDWTTLGV